MNISDHIDNIKSTFNLIDCELAGLLRFSVKYLNIFKYNNSTNHTKIDKQNMESIIRLSRVCDELKHANIRPSMSLLKMKIHQGLSMIDLIMTEESIFPHVYNLVQEAKIMQLSYDNSGLKESKSPISDDWKSSESIAGGIEKL